MRRWGVSFGSLHMRFVDGADYATLLPAHFRVTPQRLDPEAPDVELTIADADEPRPPVEGLDDRFAFEVVDGTVRYTSTITELIVDQRRKPVLASLRVWPDGQRPDFVAHYVAMNIRALLRRLGRIQLHGAAATLGESTIVLLGDKGAGKSTLSLALGRAGGRVLADDQLMLNVDGAVTVSGIDGGLRLTAETERHFFSAPLPHEAQDFAGTLKKEVSLRDYVGATPGVDAVPTACFFTKVDDRLDVAPIGRSVAVQRLLDALVPLHRFAGPGDQLAFVRAITRFVGSVDVFDLTLSPDLHQLDASVAALGGERP